MRTLLQVSPASLDTGARCQKLIAGGFSCCSTDHFNRAMIEANIQAFEPILLSHGYAAEDIDTLNRDCIEEVSQRWKEGRHRPHALKENTLCRQLTAVDSRYFQRTITVCSHKRQY